MFVFVLPADCQVFFILNDTSDKKKLTLSYFQWTRDHKDHIQHGGKRVSGNRNFIFITLFSGNDF